jgi:hypothetical protein
VFRHFYKQKCFSASFSLAVWWEVIAFVIAGEQSLWLNYTMIGSTGIMTSAQRLLGRHQLLLFSNAQILFGSAHWEHTSIYGLFTLWACHFFTADTSLPSTKQRWQMTRVSFIGRNGMRNTTKHLIPFKGQFPIKTHRDFISHLFFRERISRIMLDSLGSLSGPLNFNNQQDQVERLEVIPANLFYKAYV